MSATGVRGRTQFSRQAQKCAGAVIRYAGSGACPGVDRRAFRRARNGARLRRLAPSAPAARGPRVERRRHRCSRPPPTLDGPRSWRVAAAPGRMGPCRPEPTGIDAAPPAPASEPPRPRTLAPRGHHRGPLLRRIRLRGRRVARRGQPASVPPALYRPATHLELRPLPGRRRQLLGQHPAQRGPGGSPEEAFGCAGAIYLNALAPTIQVPGGLVVLVGPPASGKTSFLQALIARERPTGTRTTHRHRRPLQRAADHAAIRPGGHRPPPAVHRARTQRPHRRRRPPLRRDHEPRGQCRQLRSEGATTVHDVPGRRQATTPAESATHFSFA